MVILGGADTSTGGSNANFVTTTPGVQVEETLDVRISLSVFR